MISLADFAVALSRCPPREQAIARLAAFLGRYGHQPWNDIRHMPISFAHAMMEEIGLLLDAEKPKE